MVAGAADAAAQQNQLGGDHIEQRTHPNAQQLAVALPYRQGSGLAGIGLAAELQRRQGAEPGQAAQTAKALQGAAIAAVAGGPLRVDADQARLRGGAVGAGEQLPPQQQSTPHPRSQGQQQHIGGAPGRTALQFGDGGTVGVVGAGHLPPQQGLQPGGQGHIPPARQVDRQLGQASAAVGRTGMADAHPIGQSIGIQLRDGVGDGRGHRPRHRRLGSGQLQLRQQLPGQVKAGQLDRRTA